MSRPAVTVVKGVCMDPYVIERLRPGDHVCVTYDDDEQRRAALVGSARAGVRHHHRLIYFAGWPRETVLADLEAGGLDARGLLDAGQVQVRSSAEGYLPGGRFEPEAVIGCWSREIATARDRGYAGLRVIGDMTWAAGRVPGGERLEWYEAEVNRVFAGGYAMALCQYDRRLFAPERLACLSAAHPSTFTPNAPIGWRPLLRILRTDDPPGVRLAGEADASNRAALAATLAVLPDDFAGVEVPLTLDVERLRFADAAAARLLVRAAGSVPGGVRFVGCSPPLVRLMKLAGHDLRLVGRGAGPQGHSGNRDIGHMNPGPVGSRRGAGPDAGEAAGGTGGEGRPEALR
ncbi:MEDS domain-containing protein [Sphaerisporangium aureirubrum]|uniref:MEDS domain-containing protein n=1 Tax=Sphaerisporangium aureirubrum TaxID=1544736 RepID=A0ABW1NU73_9ACTN